MFRGFSRGYFYIREFFTFLVINLYWNYLKVEYFQRKLTKKRRQQFFVRICNSCDIVSVPGTKRLNIRFCTPTFFWRWVLTVFEVLPRTDVLQEAGLSCENSGLILVGCQLLQLLLCSGSSSSSSTRGSNTRFISCEAEIVEQILSNLEKGQTDRKKERR